MQAVARHDVNAAAEDSSSKLLHVHQFKEAEAAFFIIEKEVYVGMLYRCVARSRTEHIELRNAKLLQICLSVKQSIQCIFTSHALNITVRGLVL